MTCRLKYPQRREKGEREPGEEEMLLPKAQLLHFSAAAAAAAQSGRASLDKCDVLGERERERERERE